MRHSIGSRGLVPLFVIAVVCSVASAAAAAPSSSTAGIALTAASEKSSSATFEAEMELQGLYDELSQMAVPFVTQADADLLHDVVYAPDWVLVDAAGQKHTWAALRDEAARANPAPPDAAIQRIERLRLVPNGATTVVYVTSLRTVGDSSGRSGTSRLVTDTKAYRDNWVIESGVWKLKSREQLGR